MPQQAEAREGSAFNRARLADAALAGLVMLIIAMMIVPLPTWLLDQLIALNLALSLLLLVTAMYVPHGLAFTAMPSVLLITTLYRLALNVSSTRLILLQADAGQVIRAFGTFVVRGDYVVGAVIFLIVSLIQYMVVAKGGERVAEVAARFTLDAMPGKQLAIDADLRAGGLRVEAAQQRRALLERESRFYGAMDGAMKFIKGDAIASLVITAIAFSGGASVGIFNRGMSLESAVKLYALLAIGDGLVSQLPALVTSTAAGLTVTRVAEHGQVGSLGQEVIAQLLDRPRALVAVAASLCMLALVPGLPSPPFLVLSLLTAARALFIMRERGQSAHEVLDARRLPPVLLLELGPQLMAANTQGLHGLLERHAQQLAEQLGVPAPLFQVARRERLQPEAFVLRLRQAPVLRGTARDVDELARGLDGELRELWLRRARELLGLEDVQNMLDRLTAYTPTLVQNAVPRVFTLPQLAEILRRLLDEQVGVHGIERILESLARCEPQTPIDRGLELARRALRDELTERCAQAGVLRVHEIEPLIEDALRDATHTIAGDRVVALPPDLARDIVQAVRRARALHAAAPVLLTQADVRRSLREVLADELPDVTVLAYPELPISLVIERREPITVGSGA